MDRYRTIGKRTVGVAAAVAAGVIAMLAAGAAIMAGPTVWAQLSGRTRVETIQQGSVGRHARVYRPTSPGRHPGLVLNLQAAGGNGAFQEAITGFDRQADRMGWIIAYPDAARGGWNAFGCCSAAGTDDAGFLGALIDRLEASDGVDPGRVYVTGASRGGMMTYRVACELSTRVAAVAPVAGNMADATGSADAVPCQPDRPVSVLDIHGSADPEIPVEGGRSRMNVETVAYAPLRDVIGRWRRIDGCAPTPATTASAASSRTTWRCRQGSAVSSLVVEGAGHTWPGAIVVNAPGTPAAAVDASSVIAEFFASHARAEGA